MSILVVQAFSLVSSAVGLVSVMSGGEKKMTGNTRVDHRTHG